MPDDKPKEPAASAARANESNDDQPFKTAAETVGIEQPQGVRNPQLSQSPGLVKIEGSQVPGLGNGGMVNHVQGPGQNPVDPVAAGLDTGYSPPTRDEQTAITQTGILGAGNRPMTYAEKTDGELVPQAAPPDGKIVKAKTAKDLAKEEASAEPSKPGDVPVPVDLKPLVDKG